MKLIAVLSVLFVVAAAPQDDFPKPGKEHEVLKKLAGEWTVTGKFLMDPNNPMEIKGTDSSKMDLNGFWLFSTFKGDFMGKPFEGRSTMGYSPFKQKYVGTWVDSFMPHVFASEGEMDKDGKVLTMSVDGLDPGTGKPAKEKWVIEFKDENTHTFTFLDTKDKKTGEMVYTRKK